MQTRGNLVSCIEGLKDADRKYLCFVLNNYGASKHTEIHEGSLPFVNKGYAIDAIRTMMSITRMEDVAVTGPGSPKLRKLAILLEKLGSEIEGDHATFEMHFDDRKLRRSVGDMLDEDRRSIRLPFNEMTTAGIAWQEFGKKWVKPSSMVNHYVEIRRVRSTLWKVSCNKRILDRCREYMFERFGLDMKQG